MVKESKKKTPKDVVKNFGKLVVKTGKSVHAPNHNSGKKKSGQSRQQSKTTGEIANKTSFRSGWVGRMLRWGIQCGIWGGLLVALTIGGIFLSLPDPMLAIQKEVRQPSMTMLDRHGNVLSRSKGHASQPVRMASLPAIIPAAFVATEDKRFYQHFGIDPWGIARALLMNLWQGRVAQGGSTITQQVAKNLFLTPRRTLWRKAQEAVLALWLENLFSKDQILEIYLNRIYMGSGVYGLGAAARQYFNRPVAKLELAQVAMLAGLPRAPSRYNPLSNPRLSANRAQIVLQLLRQQALISEGEYQTAQQMLNVEKLPVRRLRGQYFDVWLQQTHALLNQESRQDMIVHTTLDQSLQNIIDQQIKILRPYMQAQNVQQVAVISLAADGAVRAMTGGVDWQQSQFNRATQAYRQVGSIFKLFVFAAALESGMTPDTLINIPAYDSKQFQGWWPQDHGENERIDPVSQMTLRQAMAMSSNRVAVHLTRLLGRDTIIAMARRMGISSDLVDVPSLPLGVAEIPLIQMTSAYHVVAQGGMGTTPYGITRITNLDNETLYVHQPQSAQLLDSAINTRLSQLLQAVVREGTGQQAASQSLIGGKTGTTNDYRDALFIGYGRDLTTGIWMGNDDLDAMDKTTGGGLPAQLSFMISRQFPH